MIDEKKNLSAVEVEIPSAKDMKIGVNYTGNESYLVVAGDILASWAYDNFAFTDYNGTQRTEDFYFNLNKAELTEMQLSREGGLGEWLKKIIDSESRVEIMRVFKNIILKSYGEKSEDGRRFVKSNEISTAFSQTEAYNQLFMDLISDEKNMSDFINAIIPEDLTKKEQ